MPGAIRDIGYATFEGLLSPEECDSITRAVSDPSGSGRAGARNLMSNALVAQLACDPRLLQLAAGALGSRVVPFRATLFAKSANANWQVLWHQDRALPLSRRLESHDWGPWSRKAGVLYALAPAWALERVVALRIHLDASTPDNGPLRTISGSHEEGVLSERQIRQLISVRTPHTCLIGRGGVLAMKPLLLHSSTRAQCDGPRRVLHIEYADSLDFGPGLHLCVA